MNVQKFDLAIVGSGSGNSLITPYWDDKQVAIIDSGIFGGTCLNVGCIPTKMFVYPSVLAASPHEAAELGVGLEFKSAEWPAIRDRIFTRIDAISEAGKHYRDVELDNTTLFTEEVRLHAPHQLITESGTIIEADQIVLAAGSRALLPDIPGVELDGVYTSDTIMRIDDLPQRLLVVGGGYIGAEFAGIFSALGTEVTQAVRRQGLLLEHDHTVSERFTEEARKNWRVATHRVPQRIEETEQGLQVTMQAADGSGTEEIFEVDAVLMATGRIPNADRLAPETLNLDRAESGRLMVDPYQRVLSDGQPMSWLWALGDVANDHQLKHVANHEQRVVSHNLENPGSMKPNKLSPVPGAVFSRPQVATAGLTEVQALEQYEEQDITVKIQAYGDTAYGWAMEDQTSFVKIIAQKSTGLILGVHIMGADASLLIQPVIQAMALGVDAHTMARGQYWIHPALTEVVENALLGLDVPDSGLL